MWSAKQNHKNELLWTDLINIDALTHLPLGKMAAILADDNFKCIFLNENYRISLQISLKVPRSPVDKKAALVQVMAWDWTGDKPLPEPMLTHFTDTRGRWAKEK